MSTLNAEAIRLYCGIGGERTYNHHPVYTGPYACVSPVTGSEHKKVNALSVPSGAQVMQDSGAFNDACLGTTVNTVSSRARSGMKRP